METALSVGLLVSHKAWGLGKVIQVDPLDVWVYFKDIEGTSKDAVKQLRRRVAVLTTAEKQSDSVLDNLPPMVRDGRLDPPETLRISEQQAMDMFVAKYPLFDDPAYRKHERDYKWEAHRQVAEELLSDEGRRIVAEGPPDALVHTLKKLIHGTNLLAPQEFMALNDAFKDERAAQNFAEAILKLVDEGTERAFSRARQSRIQVAGGHRTGARADMARRHAFAVPGEARVPHVPQAAADTEDRRSVLVQPAV